MAGKVTQNSKVARFLLLGIGVMVAVAVAGGCAQKPAAAAYPTKAIDVVVPFAAGGTTDLTARILGPYLMKKWGQPVNVVNKPGGSAVPGTMAVLEAAPDGYNLGFFAASNGVLNDALQKDLPYHWDTGTHIARLNYSGMTFVVKGDSKYKTLKELAEDLKKDPAKFKYGTAGVAGPSTFATAQLAEAVGLDPNKLDRVPFDGGAPAVAALAGGHVDFVAQNVPEVLELIRGGQLKPLAVTTPLRALELPDVPTTKELGYPTVDQISAFGVFGPAKLPAEIVQKWEGAVAEAMKDAQVVKDLEKIGSITGYMNSKEYRSWSEKEFKTALALAEKLGLRK